MKKKPVQEYFSTDEEHFSNTNRSVSRRTSRCTVAKNEHLHDDPHYTDDRFREPQTIFGGEAAEGILNYVYSDRIWQWDYEKASLAAKAADESGAERHTCLWYEAYLSFYFDKPVEVFHIIAGVNRSNGYSYLCFGYKEKKS